MTARGARAPLVLTRSSAQATAVLGERWRIGGDEVQGDGPGLVGVARALRARAYGWTGEVQGPLAPFVVWLVEGIGLDPEAIVAGLDPEDDEAIASALLGALEREGLAAPLMARVLPFARSRR